MSFEKWKQMKPVLMPVFCFFLVVACSGQSHPEKIVAASNPDIAVTVDAAVWKEIVAKMRNPAMALLKGDIQIEGGTFDLIGFLRLFET